MKLSVFSSKKIFNAKYSNNTYLFLRRLRQVERAKVSPNMDKNTLVLMKEAVKNWTKNDTKAHFCHMFLFIFQAFNSQILTIKKNSSLILLNKHYKSPKNDRDSKAIEMLKMKETV